MRFNATTPPRAGLEAMARELAGRRAKVTAVRRLKGGVDASTHTVRIDPIGWVVVKRTFERDGRAVATEFERLTIAETIPVPTPSPIALDLEARWFDTPSFVMTRVPGGSRFHGTGGSWLAVLAETLATIHDTSPPRHLETMKSRHAGLVWKPADERKLRRTPRVEALIATAQALQADLPPGRDDVLLHHDFHQGNVTWTAAGLGGVVDWNEARPGPAASDVAYCSADLAMIHGVRAAETFVAAYEATAGEVADLRRWQALWIVNDLRWVGYWLVGLQEAGAGVTLATLRRRLRAYADYVLART